LAEDSGEDCHELKKGVRTQFSVYRTSQIYNAFHGLPDFRHKKNCV
jgi:hypothetical protein